MAFFGSKRRRVLAVPSLKTLCYRSIEDHLDMLTSVGDVPDDLVLPILSRCSPEQLSVVEAHTERRLPTEELWRRHCERLDLGEEDREVNGKRISWKQVWKNEQKRLEDRKEQLAVRLRNMYKEEKEAKEHRMTRQITAPEPKTNRAWGFARRSGAFFTPPTTARARIAKKIGASPKSAVPSVISPTTKKLGAIHPSVPSNRPGASSSVPPRGPSSGSPSILKPSSSFSPSVSPRQSSTRSISPASTASSSSPPFNRPPGPSSLSSAKSSRSPPGSRAPSGAVVSRYSSSSSSKPLVSPSSTRVPLSSSCYTPTPPRTPTAVRTRPSSPPPSPPTKKRKQLNLPSFNKLPKAQRQK